MTLKEKKARMDRAERMNSIRKPTRRPDVVYFRQGKPYRHQVVERKQMVAREATELILCIIGFTLGMYLLLFI